MTDYRSIPEERKPKKRVLEQKTVTIATAFVTLFGAILFGALGIGGLIAGQSNMGVVMSVIGILFAYAAVKRLRTRVRFTVIDYGTSDQEAPSQLLIERVWDLWTIERAVVDIDSYVTFSIDEHIHSRSGERLHGLVLRWGTKKIALDDGNFGSRADVEERQLELARFVRNEEKESPAQVEERYARNREREDRERHAALWGKNADEAEEEESAETETDEKEKQA